MSMYIYLWLCSDVFVSSMMESPVSTLYHALQKVRNEAIGGREVYRIQNIDTHVHKTTCRPLIDTALYVMLLMQANPLLGHRGRGLGPGHLNFLGPKWHSLCSLPFQGPKKSRFQGPPLKNDPRNGYCPPQNHYVPPHKNNRNINSYYGQTSFMGFSYQFSLAPGIMGLKMGRTVKNSWEKAGEYILLL